MSDTTNSDATLNTHWYDNQFDGYANNHENINLSHASSGYANLDNDINGAPTHKFYEPPPHHSSAPYWFYNQQVSSPLAGHYTNQDSENYQGAANALSANQFNQATQTSPYNISSADAGARPDLSFDEDEINDGHNMVIAAVSRATSASRFAVSYTASEVESAGSSTTSGASSLTPRPHLQRKQALWGCPSLGCTNVSTTLEDAYHHLTTHIDIPAWPHPVPHTAARNRFLRKSSSRTEWWYCPFSNCNRSRLGKPIRRRDNAQRHAKGCRSKVRIDSDDEPLKA